MDTSIIARVSRIILEKRLGYDMPKPQKGFKSESDSVHISSVASEASRIGKALTNGDSERAQKVSAIKERVANNKFKLTDEMVETIAENIAKTLV